MILVPVSVALLVFQTGSNAGLFYPVLLNIGLFVVFFSSLDSAKNFIQKIAEKTSGASLDATGVRYTRTVTKIWCGFFITNIVVSISLIWRQAFDWWAIYNGLVSYIMIGILLVGERILRKKIQHKMRHNPLDSLDQNG